MKSFLFIFLLVLSSCKVTVNEQKADPADRKVNAVVKQACKDGKCPCDTPVGMINHGSKVAVYEKNTVSCLDTCGKYKKELTCENGKLSEDTNLLFFKCVVQDCPTCELDGNRILHGETIKAFSKKQADCAESCEDFSQVRKCNMGVLDGGSNFSFGSCQRKECRCELPDKTSFISFGGQQKFYSRTSLTVAECGKTCDQHFSQIRTCGRAPTGTNPEFILSGSSAFQHLTCQNPQGCFCTLPNSLGILNHGAEKVISKQENAACGQKCDPSQAITVKCDNGKILNKANNQEVTFAVGTAFQDHKYFCSEAGATRPCKCTLTDGSQVAVGSKAPFYQKLVGDCGSTCSAISSQKTCTETKVGSSYQYSFQGDAAYAFDKCSEAVSCSCALPGTLGILPHGNKRKIYSKETVSCGESCVSFSQEAKCITGVLKQSNNETLDFDVATFKFNCTQATCNSCPLPGWGTIDPGSPRILYPKDVMTCEDDPQILKRTFSCESGVLHRNGEPYEVNADPLKVAQWYSSYTTNCPGCPLPWGGILPEGKTINAFKNFGTVVNGCGRGCKVQERRCENGVLSGEAEYNLDKCNNTCNEEGGGAPPRLCLMRWQNTWVTPEAQVPMWSKKVVGCNDSCQNYFKLGTCKMLKGTFNVPFEYMYPSCTEVCP